MQLFTSSGPWHRGSGLGLFYHCKPHEQSKQCHPYDFYNTSGPWEMEGVRSADLLHCTSLYSLKKSTIMLFILTMPCHTLGWHVCCPYCCKMANFLEGSFLKLLWLVFHILLFPWWFVWPHQRLVTNAYLLSWEVTFSLFKPAMCWPFVIWNLVCVRNRHKYTSSLSTEVLREQSVFCFAIDCVPEISFWFIISFPST